ncbi:MAG: hypothetical protein ACYCO9_22840 [Streptosporangiaceae bacterium]
MSPSPGRSLVPWFAGQGPRTSPAMVHTLVAAQGETQLASAVVAAACWLAMAFANSRARGNGPRIISAILLAMGLSALRGSGAPRSTAMMVISVVICLVGVASVGLLFSDELTSLLGGRRRSRADKPGAV